MDDASVAVRHALALVMLLGSIPSDVRTRRVPNSWWLPFAVMAGVLTVADLADPARDPIALAVTYGVAVVVAGLMYGLWRLRLFGGADAKALMVLAFLCPWPSPQAILPVAPSLDALANGSLLMLALPMANLVLNLARGHVAFPAAFLGRPVALAKARAAHVWPMQSVGADGRVAWRFWHKASLDSLDAQYDALERAGLSKVWVTAKVPFLVPLAAGLALAWWPGDLPALLARALVALA